MPSGMWPLLVALSALAVAACSPTDPRVTLVDGWSIGPEVECEAEGMCEALVDEATQALASREPWHPAILRTSIHEEGFYPCRNGGGISQIFRSGAAGVGPIVLFELADGSRRALSIGYPLGSSVPVANHHGPEVAPWKCSDTEPLPTEHPTEAVPRL